jgi:MHS family proline/betaine transporter-like MFS transporter
MRLTFCRDKAFSTAVTIFGGFAPFVATWLIAQTGDSLSPSYYLIFTALLSLIALIAIQRRSRRRDRTFALPGRGKLAAPRGAPGVEIPSGDSTTPAVR